MRAECEGAQIGCVACKKRMADLMLGILTPIHQKRAAYASDPAYVEGILAEGNERARQKAEETMKKVRAAVRLS